MRAISSKGPARSASSSTHALALALQQLVETGVDARADRGEARWWLFVSTRLPRCPSALARPHRSSSLSSPPPSRSAITSSMRIFAAPMRCRQTAINSEARATRSASRSTSTSLPSSSRRI